MYYQESNKAAMVNKYKLKDKMDFIPSVWRVQGCLAHYRYIYKPLLGENHFCTHYTQKAYISTDSIANSARKKEALCFNKHSLKFKNLNQNKISSSS